MITKKEFLKRIKNKYIVQSNGCWIWQGSLNPGGYSQISIENKLYRVHRVILFFKNGVWPRATDHLCRNRACINEAHLEDVTQRENNKRMGIFRKSKTHCKYGHEFTPENTIINKDGTRGCRHCHKIRGAAYRSWHN